MQALYPEWEAHELLAYGFNPHINHIRVFFTRKDQEKIIYCRHFSQIDYIAAHKNFLESREMKEDLCRLFYEEMMKGFQ